MVARVRPTCRFPDDSCKSEHMHKVNNAAPIAEAAGTESRNDSSSTNVAQVIELLRRNDGDDVARHDEVIVNEFSFENFSTRSPLRSNTSRFSAWNLFTTLIAVGVASLS